jgi:hypothetical protein
MTTIAFVYNSKRKNKIQPPSYQTSSANLNKIAGGTAPQSRARIVGIKRTDTELAGDGVPVGADETGAGFCTR